MYCYKANWGVGCSREWAVCHSTRKAPSIIINITTGVHLLVVLLLLEILCSQLPVKDVVLLQVLIPLSCSSTNGTASHCASSYWFGNSCFIKYKLGLRWFWVKFERWRRITMKGTRTNTWYRALKTILEVINDMIWEGNQMMGQLPFQWVGNWF
jgi:hypothetical protein